LGSRFRFSPTVANGRIYIGTDRGSLFCLSDRRFERRWLVDVGRSLLELFEKRGVALISVAESLDTASAAGRLVITIMAAESEWEREAIGERTRDALRHKRTSGERVGNIRFRFRLSPGGKHVEPDPGEQGVLTEIRHLRQSGHTLRGIASALNRQSLRTRRGSAWRLERVARIIKQATGAH
jgi:DNA invertase Pin-like site-specific DNA recombinase